MTQIEKLSVLKNAWHPDLADDGDQAVAAWRVFDLERSILEPDEIRVAPLMPDGPGHPRTVVNGLFVGGPRLVRSADGWGLLAIRREEETWRLQCHHLDEELSPASVEPISDEGRSVTGFAVANGRREPVIAWVEVAPSGRRLMVRYLAGEDTVRLDQGAIWSPAVIQGTGGNIVLAWENGGRIRLARLDDDLQPTEEVTATLPGRLLGHPDIATDEETVYMVAQSNGDWGEGTERLNGDTRLHAFRWSEAGLEVSGGQPDGQIPIPTRSRFDVYRDEPPGNRRLPLRPKAIVDQQGGLHVFFRHFRDAQPNDWGWTLRCVQGSPAGFSPPEDVSRAAGYPDGQFQVIPGGEGWLIAVAESDYPVSHHGFAGRTGTGAGRVSFCRLRTGKIEGDGPWTDPPAMPRRSHKAGPTACRPGWEDFTLVYADLHRHSDLSRCVPEGDASTAEHLRWAVDHENMGGICLTDHWPFHATNPEQKPSLALIDAAREPGRFAPIFGAEPGGWPEAGDVNVYCRDLETVPEVERIIREYRKDLPGAVEYVRDSGLLEEVILQRHFHGMVSGGWPGQLSENALAADDDVEPLIEVIQTRGHAIAWYCRMLQEGQHKGVTGGSDHCRPTDRKSAVCLTGLWVKEVSSRGIWDALLNRRTFATNGVRMDIRITAREVVIGETTRADGPISVRWSVRSTSPLEEIDIYRDGCRLETIAGADDSSAAGTVNDFPAGEGETSYFLVARDESGGLGISSPVWVSREGG